MADANIRKAAFRLTISGPCKARAWLVDNSVGKMSLLRIGKGRHAFRM